MWEKEGDKANRIIPYGCGTMRSSCVSSTLHIQSPAARRDTPSVGRKECVAKILPALPGAAESSQANGGAGGCRSCTARDPGGQTGTLPSAADTPMWKPLPSHSADRKEVSTFSRAAFGCSCWASRSSAGQSLFQKLPQAQNPHKRSAGSKQDPEQPGDPAESQPAPGHPLSRTFSFLPRQQATRTERAPQLVSQRAQ